MNYFRCIMKSLEMKELCIRKTLSYTVLPEPKRRIVSKTVLKQSAERNTTTWLKRQIEICYIPSVLCVQRQPRSLPVIVHI